MNIYDIGLKIAKARHEAGYTQREFAKKIGVTRNAVQCWENGTHPPSIKNRKRIKDAINLDIDALLGDYHGDV
ncbi:helix-turn-helix domain-containing protein [Macrococcus armenti]|uniref:helix-turn-helix domain-containing protein n=1 Tax=Macrococcus armenti TaxID=2875764 RepID=UPI001CCBE8BC|nr:helix-turn-helix transcriptional regulator [Macrococcus armenti]UBH16376.1 helix-turn-helix domain-containing protein [Macrococcus armenti]UBH18732.1 helix-turn-helix domain-containing protein [Macrococcus armenti]UBH21004.1 helix-turn-helix domain-containing protein [Macrococcus armenti]